MPPAKQNLKRSLLDVGVCVLCTMFVCHHPLDQDNMRALYEETLLIFTTAKFGFSHLFKVNSFQDWKWHIFGPPHLPVVNRPPIEKRDNKLLNALPYMIPDFPFTMINSTSMNSQNLKTYFVNHLSNITHELECQIQKEGNSFMFFDRFVEGLMKDVPLVPLSSEASGFGDGGEVQFVNIHIKDWIKEILRNEMNEAAAKYCVEEIRFLWNDNPVIPANNLSRHFMHIIPWIHRITGKADMSDVVTNLWLHSQGALTQGHYDGAHNVLSQLMGRKRVTLLPPTASHCLHLFPALHPRARKSQIPVYAKHPINGSDMFPNFLSFITSGTWITEKSVITKSELKFPRFLTYAKYGHCETPHSPKSTLGRLKRTLQPFHNPDQRPFIAELSPGDSISIPPYWVHFVESLDTSVSLNVFSPSKEEELVQSVLYTHPLPFDPLWPKRMTARAVTKLFESISSRLGLHLPSFIRNLLESKYGLKKLNRAHLSKYADDGDDVKQGSVEGAREWLPWCREPSIDKLIGLESKELHQHSSGKFLTVASDIAREVSILKKSGLGHIVMEEFIENVVALTFGVEAVPLYLCTCFTAASLRDLLHGGEYGPPPSLNARSCVRQWDMFVES